MGKIKIQELSTSGCSNCATAKQILKEIKLSFPEVQIEHIDMSSEKGQELLQKYGIMLSPGIIINGELFSVGGLDKNKLIEKIKSLL